MSKVTPYLWYNKDAEAAMHFYVEIFNSAPFKKTDSKIIQIDHWPTKPLDGPLKGLEGGVANGIFELAGQRLMAFDGGPDFRFNEAISLMVECESQQEVDYYWERLSAVPEAEACGWLKDKFGLSWQIIPTVLGTMLTDPDSTKSSRVMQAMLQMKKINVAALQRAFDDRD